jgi:hypothetical protein
MEVTVITGIAWTTLLLVIKLGSWLGLAGFFHVTRCRYPVHCHKFTTATTAHVHGTMHSGFQRIISSTLGTSSRMRYSGTSSNKTTRRCTAKGVIMQMLTLTVCSSDLHFGR